MNMGQVGIYSASLLMLHDHLDDNFGGVLNAYSRDGAFMETYRTGALAVHVANDAEVNSSIGIMTLLKQYTANRDIKGEFQFRWDSRSSVLGIQISTRLYVNNVAVGVLDTHDSNGYDTIIANYDLDIAAGDLLQLWGRRHGANTVFVRNFRIYYDWAIKYFGNNQKLLTAPLNLANTELIDVAANF